jgi:hypothetical protein
MYLASDRIRAFRVFAMVLSGVLGGPAAAQEARDMKLEDVGFTMRPANTPGQIERLRLLPPRTFVARSRNGRRYYIYADPDYCKCVFLGNELAMRNYRDLVTPPQAPPMPAGPAGSSLTGPLVVELAPNLDLTIGDGDILDYSY